MSVLIVVYFKTKKNQIDVLNVSIDKKVEEPLTGSGKNKRKIIQENCRWSLVERIFVGFILRNKLHESKVGIVTKIKVKSRLTYRCVVSF